MGILGETLAKTAFRVTTSGPRSRLAQTRNVSRSADVVDRVTHNLDKKGKDGIAAMVRVKGVGRYTALYRAGRDQGLPLVVLERAGGFYQRKKPGTIMGREKVRRTYLLIGDNWPRVREVVSFVKDPAQFTKDPRYHQSDVVVYSYRVSTGSGRSRRRLRGR